MLGRGLDRRRFRQHDVGVFAGPRLDVVQRHRAGGQCSGLVEHDGVDALDGLQQLRVFDQDAQLCAATGADQDCGRGGQPERARAGDDQHRDSCGECRRRRLPGEQPPGHRRRGDQQYRRHEDRRDPVGRPLDRGLAVLGVADQLGHPGQLGVGADLGGAHEQPAVGVQRSADDDVPGGHVDRHRLAGHRRRVQSRCAVDDYAVGGDPLPRSHHHHVADLQLRDGHAYLVAVAQHRGVLGAQAQQRAQRRPGRTLRPRFGVVTGQLEHRDRRRDFEVHRTGTPKHRRRRPEVGGQRAQRHQGVHRRRVMPQAEQRRAVERIAAPRHDGRAQRQRQPLPADELPPHRH